MQKPIHIVFEGLEPDPVVEARCRAEAEKLERYYERITSCTVSISQPHRRHRVGSLYSVGVQLAVPGRELVANRAPSEHHRNENLNTAIREAFDRARRQLEDYARGQRGDVKQHRPPGREALGRARQRASSQRLGKGRKR